MHQPINRRTLLKAAGVSMALPVLESMHPVLGRESVVGRSPKRMVFICTALGLHSPNLWPKTAGENYESTKYLDLLKQHRSEFTLFSGLSHENQTGRQPHDSEMTWLTSARKPGVSGFRNTISVDQVAAKQIGNATRFPSMTLGTVKPQSQSYTSGGIMIPAQTSPAKVFSQMFMKGKPKEVQAVRRRLKDGRSILDQLGSQTQALRRRASSSDNHLLDDYLESVRKAESSIANAEGWLDQPKPETSERPPTDINDPKDLIGKTRLMMNLVPLMVQSDSTRVISLMVQDHYVVPTVEGVTVNHHNLSHHGQDQSKIEQLQKIESGIVKCFSDLLGQLKNKSELGATLLNNTSVLFGSNLGNANAHDARNLPIFLAGGGFKHGSFVQGPKNRDVPLCDLFVTLLNQSGIQAESFGQSSGSLSW